MHVLNLVFLVEFLPWTNNRVQARSNSARHTTVSTTQYRRRCFYSTLVDAERETCCCSCQWAIIPLAISNIYSSVILALCDYRWERWLKIHDILRAYVSTACHSDSIHSATTFRSTRWPYSDSVSPQVSCAFAQRWIVKVYYETVSI